MYRRGDTAGYDFGRYAYDYPSIETSPDFRRGVRELHPMGYDYSGFDYNRFGTSNKRRPNEPDVFNNLWRPRTDILEENDKVVVEFELPGVDVNDISLTATENSLTLSSLKSQSQKELAGVHYLRERHFGNFFRRVTLPDYVDVSKREAVLTHGVLKVTMPIKPITQTDAGTRIPITFKPTEKSELNL